MKSLKGYRIGTLVDYENSNVHSENYASISDRRKWAEIVKDDVVLKLPIYNNAPRDMTSFKEWWNQELQHARTEDVTLLVVDVYKQNVWKNMLKKIEEDDFESGVECEVRVTTLDSLLETIRTGSLPVDLWGDDIARGARASIFYKALFVIAGRDSTGLISNLITQNGGLVLNEQILKNIKEEDEMSRLCYVVADGMTEQRGNEFINSNPLLADFSEDNDIIFVNSIWLRACVDANEKINPEECPVMFQPQTWDMQRLCSGECSQFVVSISGFTGAEYHSIVMWLEKMGITYAESLSQKTTHLISHHRTSEFKDTFELGAKCVSLDWLFHIMQHGYKTSCEQNFPVPITITIIEKIQEDIQERDIYVMDDSIPISSVLEVYANAEGVPVSQYWFIFNGKKIFDHEITLSILGLGHGSTIIVEKKKGITISLQDSEGQMSFLIKRTSRISKVFDSYAENQGIFVSECEFYFDDQKIEDYEASLEELGIDDDGIIIVKVSPMNNIIMLRYIIIRIKDIDGEETLFKMKKTSRMMKMFEAYAVRMNTPVSNLEFILNGEKIENSNATPMSLGLESDDVINVRRIAQHID